MLEFNEFVCDIQDHFTDDQIKSFLKKYYQSPNMRIVNLSWSFKFDDYCGEPYLRVTWNYDDDHLPIRYLIDESELNKYLEKKNEAAKIQKELTAKQWEDRDRAEFARLKKKYEA